MTRFGWVLFLLLLAACPAYSRASQQKPKHEAWYERVLRQVNPDNTDFGSIWEQRKRDLIGQLGNRYFQYSFGATAGIVVLMIVTFARHVSHRRALEVLVQSIADIRRHDEYARQIAREAIRRYNDHIESCNRMIEASESGLWKWISSADLDAMKFKMQCTADELAEARKEVKRLEDELQEKSSVIAEISLRSNGVPQKSGEPLKHSVPAPHVDRINQLELELNEEKKKNQRLKGTALNVRNH
jgi:endonuclease III